ncbi:MAG: thiolase family protein [Syntrophobacteraceae bacterium]
MENIVIVGAARTAIGSFLGMYKDVSPIDLGIVVAKAAMERAGVKPEQIDEVLCGMVHKAGVKGNPARQIQLKVGVPKESGAVTIEQQCSSSMRALEIASQQILLGKLDIALVVGAECMTFAPHLLMNVRGGYRLGAQQVVDSLHNDSLCDAFFGYMMGVTAENLAKKYNISRQEQDELALLSQKRAVAAINEGRFKEEIVPVEVKTKKGTVLIDTDEHPRRDASMEALSKLKPAFIEGGTVTAGNASGINDGAAAVVVMTEKKAKELGLKPLAIVKATATYGVEPEIMGIGPIYAVPKALKFAGLEPKDIELYEINEAFAAQFLACNRELKLDMNKVNVNGSGIALGHPVGDTGLRIVISLMYEMRRRGLKYGVASLCAGGGPAMAAVIETV